jgi:uncharacterized protein
MMQLTLHRNAGDFLARVQAELEQDEVANNLMLGIALRLQSSLDLVNPQPFLATVADQHGLALAALMTPPHPMTLYQHRIDIYQAYDVLADYLLTQKVAVQTVSGRSQVASEFAKVWSTKMHLTQTVHMHMRIYELRKVLLEPTMAGTLQQATIDDIDLVVAWIRHFVEDAHLHDDRSQIPQLALGRIEDGGLFLWTVDGHAVSMAATSRPMRHGITVNLVYTPLEMRGRGCATSCVSALSQHLLDEGWKFCTLFTDLANPTSNSIYQRIGYRPVCDFDEYGFEPG